MKPTVMLYLEPDGSISAFANSVDIDILWVDDSKPNDRIIRQPNIDKSKFISETTKYQPIRQGNGGPPPILDNRYAKANEVAQRRAQFYVVDTSDD